MNSTEVSASKPSGGAQRMRLYRQRRQRGDQSVRILLLADEIETLVRKGYLDADVRHDRAAIQQAAQFYLSDALWDAEHGV
jgi:cbb3-type cytochrome oxidase subunit 3